MKLTNKKPKFIKPLKVLSATALSLSLLMGIAPSGHAFDTDIIKKTDKCYYSLSKRSISKVFFTGEATDIYKLGDYEEFIAKKGNTFYFFAREDWNSPSMTIYKTTLNNPTKRTKVSETKEDKWSVSNGKLTIKDNNKKKIVLKVDKDGSLY